MYVCQLEDVQQPFRLNELMLSFRNPPTSVIFGHPFREVIAPEYNWLPILFPPFTENELDFTY